MILTREKVFFIMDPKIRSTRLQTIIARRVRRQRMEQELPLKLAQAVIP